MCTGSGEARGGCQSGVLARSGGVRAPVSPLSGPPCAGLPGRPVVGVCRLVEQSRSRYFMLSCSQSQHWHAL